MNIFNDTPSSWGLAIPQWSGMLHNPNTIVSDYLGRLFFFPFKFADICYCRQSHRWEFSAHVLFPQAERRNHETQLMPGTCYMWPALLETTPTQCQATAKEERMTLGSPKVQAQRPPSQSIWAHQGQDRASLAQRSKHWPPSGL